MNKKKIKKENIAKEINNEDIDYNEDYHLAKVPKDIVTLYNSLKNAAFGTDTTLQFDADGGVKKGELIETTSRLNIFSRLCYYAYMRCTHSINWWLFIWGIIIMYYENDSSCYGMCKIKAEFLHMH